MPIYKKVPTEQGVHKTSEELETTSILESDMVQDAITNNIAGMKWEVDFYNQLLDNGQTPMQPDVGLNQTQQAYRLIRNLDITLTTPLSASKPEDLGGEFYINIGGAVNKEDIFIAKARDSRNIIFKIDEVTYESYENNTIYKAEFKFFSFTSDETTYTDIINKVVTEYRYDADFKYTNTAPIIMMDNAFNFEDGIRKVETIMKHYIKKYFNSKVGALTLEVDGKLLLDQYLNKFIRTVFDSGDYRVLSDMKNMDSGISSDITIFDALVTELDVVKLDQLQYSGTMDIFKSKYYRDIVKVEYMASVETDDGKLIEDASYFIDGTFYTKSFDVEDSFLSLLYAAVTGDSLTFTVVNEQLETIGELSSVDSYYRIPILCFIFKCYLWNLKE